MTIRRRCEHTVASIIRLVFAKILSASPLLIMTTRWLHKSRGSGTTVSYLRTPLQHTALPGSPKIYIYRWDEQMDGMGAKSENEAMIRWRITVLRCSARTFGGKKTWTCEDWEMYTNSDAWERSQYVEIITKYGRILHDNHPLWQRGEKGFVLPFLD